MSPRASDTGGLRSALERFIARHAGAGAEASGFARLPSGTAREAWAIDVDVRSGALAGRHGLIYLLDRGGKSLRSRLDRGGEFRVLAAMRAAGVRVPKPYWLVTEGDVDGLAPGLILERVDGEVVTRRLLRDPIFDAVRPRLCEQMGAELARIHAAPTAELAWLPSTIGRVAELEEELGAIDEPHPALELALRWLIAREPVEWPPRRPVVVHGDYRLGNVVVDPETGLRAVLDWELSHLGHPGEDLGWLAIRFWGYLDRPGWRGIGPRERLVDAYVAAGGQRLGAAGERYWEVFANVRWAITTLRQARRHLSGAEPGLDLASIGRHCAEVEWEILRLLDDDGRS